jgi:hypothetical protein
MYRALPGPFSHLVVVGAVRRQRTAAGPEKLCLGHIQPGPPGAVDREEAGNRLILVGRHNMQPSAAVDLGRFLPAIPGGLVRNHGRIELGFNPVLAGPLDFEALHDRKKQPPDPDSEFRLGVLNCPN